MSANIYYSDVGCLSDRELFRTAYESVSGIRRDKTDRLRFAEAKRRSLGAGLLLMRALEDLGLDPALSETGVGEFGKPYLKAYPQIRFNLSHSGELAMCVISDAETGCDVERAGRIRTEIADRFFAEEERKRILEADEAERSGLMCRYWTLKESYLKCTGKGMSVPLNGFWIEICQKGVSVHDAEGRKPVALLLPDCPDGYYSACCFAVPELPAPVRTENVDLMSFLQA